MKSPDVKTVLPEKELLGYSKHRLRRVFGMGANFISNDTDRIGQRMSDEGLLAWLRMSFVCRGRVREALKLMTVLGLPDEIYEMPRSEVKAKIGRESAMALFDSEAEERAEEALTWLHRVDTADVILATDEDYPKELLATGAGDLLFFARGNRKTLGRSRLTVMTTANADSEGCRNAQEFCAALATRGVTCVMAAENEADRLGVAAAAATEGGALIISGVGPDRVPSVRCLEAWRKVERTGLILTGEFPGTAVTEAGVAARNYFLAAGSRGILVIESERRDPILDVTRLAAELGRDVAAVPGSIHSRTYKGNHLLIRQGAKLTESLDDLMKDFGLSED